MHPNLSELNQHFGIDDVLRFSAEEGGLWRASVTTDRCVGELYRHGAHITRWRPQGHDEVLWLSSQANYAYGSAIRGGVPICFPWFAGHKPPGLEDAPSHGYARTATWEYADVQDDSRGLTVTLRCGIAPFALSYAVTFADTLTMALEVTNTSNQPASFEAALHSYFVISQIKQVVVHGLEGASYLDTVGGLNQPMTQDDQPIRFDQETDRVYTSSQAVRIEDPGLARAITIHKTGSNSTVVWNPWAAKAEKMSDFGDEEWAGMLCVETANIQPDEVVLEPGQGHVMQAIVSVEAIA